MDYYNLILDKLKLHLSSQEELFNECEVDVRENIFISIKATEFCIDYFNIRFTNNLKHYNNDKIKANDKFSAKKAIEYLNIYTEEFFFLDKPKIKNNYIFRKQLRAIIHMLNNEIE